MNSLIDRLSTDLKPVRPALPPVRATLLWVFFSALGTLALFATVLHFRTNWEAASARITFWLCLGSLLATMTGCAAAAIRSGLPGRSRSARSELLGPLAFAFFFGSLAFDLFATPARGSALGASLLVEGLDPRSGMHCSFTVMFLAIVPALLLAWRLRTTAPTEPRKAGLWAGLAAGAAGAFGLAFCCPSENPVHLLIWHGLPVLALSLLGGLIGQRLLRW